jgi:hypothetical protein
LCRDAGGGKSSRTAAEDGDFFRFGTQGSVTVAQ